MEVPMDAGATRDVYTDAGELRGVWTRGSDPKELVLSDGTRLSLRGAEQGQVIWCRVDGSDDDAETLSVGRALDLAGDEFSDYVEVRTRAEAGWLRAVADWCSEEAGRLEGELAGSARLHNGGA
jgi:hypothetical protein